MNFKKLDPKILATTLAFLLAVTAVFALVGWGMLGFERAKHIENPTEKALQKDGLL